ncbi:DNA polymerase III subunit gamma and tau [Rathayibacter sp. KR2-224]|uniref:DNA polymerase III subunit gamma and tau n=1 Tax=Rathayibacter sp. KR2-224 TaxID=3400913 RepID=UPI003C1139C7
MVTALYRRYRPETFAEMIGQSQVTEPLMTALRTNRVNHAYLFSGPRGCGKTTSARILARCLNCAEGPTDTPCGKCQSCIELGRGGQGSLDVVEIDAASHNGVDDARDIRERAIFAPARDRYKIFILDEAHMVTPQGFNALLKIVEEPPEHVKFIFATTEPDKVIGTIRSRTHHYPFRLVPPAQMLDYVQQLCESEGMAVAPGVLPLVVRAGGGSPRDTLSLLDQLIAGSEGSTIQYERAVALLGYTHAALLDEVVDAIGAMDAASAFAAVDRVIQTGQDPRRFVEDLLERLRDLIIVAATSPDAAAAVLRGTPQEELDRMSVQASVFGAAELSRCADIVNAALTEMTGATSPRLHLELMIARMLVPASDATERGALARVERLERRVGVQGTTEAVARDAREQQPPARPTQPAASSAAAATSAWAADSASTSTTKSAPAGVTEPAATSIKGPAPTSTKGPAPASSTSSAPVGTAASAPASSASATTAGSAGTSAAPPQASSDPAVAQAAAFAAAAAAKKGVTPGASGADAPATPGQDASAWATPGVTADGPAVSVGPVTTQQVRDAWPEILESVAEASRNAWAVVYTATVRALDGDVLSLTFPSANDVESFRGTPGAKDAASEVLRQSIVDLLGIRVKFVAKPAGSEGGPGGGNAGTGPEGPESSAPDVAPVADAPGAKPASAPAPAAQDVAPPQRRERVSTVGSGGARGSAQSRVTSGTPAALSGASQSSSAVSWSTVPIPGSSATAVLERPSDESDQTEPDGPVTEPQVADRPRDNQPTAGPAPTQFTDAEAPDDDEPPFPDEYPGEPSLASLAGSAAPSFAASPSATQRTSTQSRPTASPAPQPAPPTVQGSAGGDLSRASSPSAGSSGASSSGTGSSGANPSGANPAGANPIGANPTGANPNRRDAASDRSARATASVGFREPARYGEAVVRELLGAKFIEEQEITSTRSPGASAGAGGSGWSR